MIQQPNWTDILQAFAAAIGVIFLIINFWYLHKTDKKQQQQIDLVVSTNKDSIMPNFVIKGEPTFEQRNPDFMIVLLRNVGGSAKQISATVNSERLFLKEINLTRISKGAELFLIYSVDRPFDQLAIIPPKGDLTKAQIVIKSELIFLSELNIKYSQKIGGVIGEKNGISILPPNEV